MVTRRVICPLLSQYVTLLARKGSFGGGWTLPSTSIARDVIREHYRLAEELYGPERCLPDMRKFAIKYSQLHPQHLDVRADFCAVCQPGAWRDVLAKWYRVDGPGVHPPVSEPNPQSSEAALAVA
jgi:tRNA-dihydrouridine synthase B